MAKARGLAATTVKVPPCGRTRFSAVVFVRIFRLRHLQSFATRQSGGDPVNSSPAWGLLLSEFYRTRNPKHDSPVEGLLERGINISRNARSRASDNQSDLRKVLLRLPTSTSLSRTASFILYEPGTGDFAPVGVPGDSESRNLINEIPTSIYRWFPTYVASCLEALILPN